MNSAKAANCNIAFAYIFTVHIVLPSFLSFFLSFFLSILMCRSLASLKLGTRYNLMSGNFLYTLKYFFIKIFHCFISVKTTSGNI